jgi:flagellar protein FliO/FliZ
LGWLLEVLQALAVLIVVVIIFFLAWYIPHLIAKKGSFGGSGRNIAILEKIPVSKDSYIMLLKTFDKVIVVGVTPGGMTTLKELEGGDYKAEDVQPAQSFSHIFKKAVGDSIPEGRMKDAYERFVNRSKGGDGD